MVEILIEKHRNGPVGKVDLYFDEKLTTFMRATAFYSIMSHRSGVRHS